MLEIHNVTKTIGTTSQKNEILRGVSLNISGGESVAIVGKSGSGKSTLLSILSLLDSPTTGQYFINGSDVSSLSDKAACRLRSETFGFVFQRFFLMKQLSALQNVTLSLLNGQPGVPFRRHKRTAQESLNRLGISHLSNRKPHQMSGGEQQRVAIARALVRNPTVLFADEPTGALDSKTSDSVLELLSSLSNDGTTVVMVTHDASCAQRMQRTITIADGLIAPAARPAPSPHSQLDTLLPPPSSKDTP